MSPYVALGVKAACSAWMIVVSAWDARERRIPNALTLPAMLIALGWQVYLLIAQGAGGLWSALIAWLILFLLWQAHVIGGGDAKVLMALVAMFPTLQFLLLFSLVKLVVTIPLLVKKYWGQRPADLLGQARERVSSARILPDEQELQTLGQSNCWTYCLPGIIYLWWLS